MNLCNARWLTVLIAFFFMAGLPAGEIKAETRIGIIMYSNQARYLEAVQNFRDQLAQAGYKEPRTKFTVMSAESNKAKLAEQVRELAALRPELIFSLGTSATAAVAREIKDIPIVFAVIYDPVAAGIADSLKSSGNNTTGVSSKIPMSKLLQALQEFSPVRRLAVPYTPGEKNSETQLRELQRLQSAHRLRVIPVIINKNEDIAQLLPEVVRKVDALYVTGSSLIDVQVTTIVSLATQKKVITVTHLEDLVEKGVLIGLGADPHAAGRQAGKKALRIINGARPASLPIEAGGQIYLMLNMKTAAAGQFHVPPEFLKKVRRVSE